jgi:DNA-binding transcriptional MocR family regulator
MAINYFPIALIDSAISIKANLSLNCSGFIQAILGNWLIEQNFSLCNHLDPFRQELKEKQTFLDAQGIGFEGGFFVELTLPEKEINLEWCAALLDEEGVAVCPMRLFSDHPSAMNKIRLAVAKISLADLSKSISIIHNFAKK